MVAAQLTHVLYIEDDEGQARLVQKKLSRLGYEVIIAFSGQEGIDNYRSAIQVDVVLVDHSLPDFSGLEILRLLLAENPFLPVIMVTGRGDEETAVQSMKLGAKDYIVKDVVNNYIELLPPVIDQAVLQHRLILEKKRMEQVLFRREAILSAVAYVAERLLKTTSWKNHIDEILVALGEGTQVSRVYLIENEVSEEAVIVKRCFEWVENSVNVRIQEYPCKTYETIGMQALISTFEKGQPFYGLVQGLPEPLRLRLAENEVKSIILMPIFAGSKWWGLIGFDERQERVWESAEVETIRTAANILGAALQRQMTEAALYQAQKLESIGLLAGGVAHDFNNMLTGILSQISLALMFTAEESRALKPLNKAIKATEQAADLVQQLLGYAGKGQYNVSAININQLIRDNLDLLQSVLKKRAKLQLELTPNIPTIEADRSQLQQVIMNLVMNAAEAITDGDGLVTLATSFCTSTQPLPNVGQPALPSGTYVYLTVEDDGSGISQEIVNRIFDPFFTTKTIGRGLGLSAALGIVNTHGGGVRVLGRRDEERGSRFVIFFPISDKAVISTAASAGLGDTVNARILIIDDQEMVLEAAKDGLESMGAIIFSATSGSNGIKLYQEKHRQIDLIILDMQMPGMDGPETFVHLKKINPHLKVILSSGYSEAEAIRDFKDDAIVAFLKKPYRLEEIVTEVRKAIA